MLIDIKPRIRQPRTRSDIDWSHPITRALRFAYTCDSARPYMDLVRGRNGAPTSGVSMKPNPYGIGPDLAGVLDGLNFGAGGIPNAGGSVTVFARLKARSIAPGVFGTSAGSVGSRSYTWFVNANVSFTFRLVTIGSITSTITSVDGHWTDVGMAYTYGVGVRFFIRDLSTGIVQYQTIAGAFLPVSGTTFSSIGAYPTDPLGIATPILLTYFWDRVLTDQEFLALSVEPYAFVAPVRPVRTLVKYPWNHSWGTVPRLVLSSSDRLFQVPAHPQQGRGY